MPGRMISNNAIIGIECIHALKTKNRRDGSLALKLDMSKADDRVEWQFLRFVMLKVGFSEAWLINFDKSGLCVSRSVSTAEGNRLVGLIGVRHVKCHECYLGLSCFIGRSKKVLFENIKDRLWGKVKVWRSKLLSMGGKEVMIKSVLQSILAYTMSIFKLLKGFIKEVHRIMNRFWWGSLDTSRRIHQASWVNSSLVKLRAALVLEIWVCSIVFNRTLLGKQGWRLLKFSSSFVARVLRGCYYPTSNFMEADTKSNGSWVWISLIWGHGILEKGISWRIGTGSSV
ncbi:hypothetical protein LWI28_013024 [Acer negundo]|uniref:Reverse transcriptase n=1 Tax=Acer negundo TaxID=4023 RepID=A0AAD5NS20_ACENE|nr:hypothetical protein LWI28_013024 [Acer negundo]